MAAILTDLKLDDATIAAALLHDTIEGTEANRARSTTCSAPTSRAGRGLTKLKRLDLVTKEAKQAENLRKLLLAIADDVRVLLVKLADRLDNMRTLDFMPDASRRRTPTRRWKSMHGWPAAWACMRCARTRGLSFARSTRRPTRW